MNHTAESSGRPLRRQNLSFSADTAHSYGNPITLVSEDIDIEINSKNTRDGSVYIIHDEPVPFNLLSLITKYEVREA